MMRFAIYRYISLSCLGKRRQRGNLPYRTLVLYLQQHCNKKGQRLNSRKQSRVAPSLTLNVAIRVQRDKVTMPAFSFFSIIIFYIFNFTSSFSSRLRFVLSFPGLLPSQFSATTQEAYNVTATSAISYVQAKHNKNPLRMKEAELRGP